MQDCTNNALATAYMELARHELNRYSKVQFESQDRNPKIATARKAWSCLNCKNLHIPWETRRIVNRWLNAELWKAYEI